MPKQAAHSPSKATSLIPQPAVSAKRRRHSDDDDGENKKPGQAANNAWSKFSAQLKRSKNKDHDNHDASKFVSQYRKPLANMQSTDAAAIAAAAASSDGTINASSQKHVRPFFSDSST